MILAIILCLGLLPVYAVDDLQNPSKWTLGNDWTGTTDTNGNLVLTVNNQNNQSASYTCDYNTSSGFTISFDINITNSSADARTMWVMQTDGYNLLGRIQRRLDKGVYSYRVANEYKLDTASEWSKTNPPDAWIKTGSDMSNNVHVVISNDGGSDLKIKYTLSDDSLVLLDQTITDVTIGGSGILKSSIKKFEFLAENGTGAWKISNIAIISNAKPIEENTTADSTTAETDKTTTTATNTTAPKTGSIEPMIIMSIIFLSSAGLTVIYKKRRQSN